MSVTRSRSWRPKSAVERGKRPINSRKKLLSQIILFAWDSRLVRHSRRVDLVQRRADRPRDPLRIPLGNVLVSDILDLSRMIIPQGNGLENRPLRGHWPDRAPPVAAGPPAGTQRIRVRARPGSTGRQARSLARRSLPRP